MTALIISTAVAITLLAATLALVCAGFRSGDRPGDARVTAWPGSVPTPDGRQPTVVATVHNGGGGPVMVSLSLRRSRIPVRLTAGTSVAVPYRTTRRRYRPGTSATVGVADAGETARWHLLAPSPRHRRLVAVIGQPGRRLRVLTVPVTRRLPATAASGDSPPQLPQLDDFPSR